MITLTIFQGDSSDTIVATVYSAGVQVTGLIAAGYTATFTLVDVLGNTPLITKTMTEDSDTFRTALTSSDTPNIAPGNYKGISQVINSGLGYKKEDHIDIVVNAQGYIE